MTRATYDGEPAGAVVRATAAEAWQEARQLLMATRGDVGLVWLNRRADNKVELGRREPDAAIACLRYDARSPVRVKTQWISSALLVAQSARHGRSTAEIDWGWDVLLHEGLCLAITPENEVVRILGDGAAVDRMQGYGRGTKVYFGYGWPLREDWPYIAQMIRMREFVIAKPVFGRMPHLAPRERPTP